MHLTETHSDHSQNMDNSCTVLTKSKRVHVHYLANNNEAYRCPVFYKTVTNICSVDSCWASQISYSCNLARYPLGQPLPFTHCQIQRNITHRTRLGRRVGTAYIRPGETWCQHLITVGEFDPPLPRLCSGMEIWVMGCRGSHLGQETSQIRQTPSE